MDKIDQQYLNEIVGGQEAGDPDAQDDLKVHEENTTIEELEVGTSKVSPQFRLHILENRFGPLFQFVYFIFDFLLRLIKLVKKKRLAEASTGMKAYS